jgi:integrase
VGFVDIPVFARVACRVSAFSPNTYPFMHKPLTETKIKAARPTHEPYKLRDERGLYLLVTPATERTPSGSKLWRLRFQHPTKRAKPTKKEIAKAAKNGVAAVGRPLDSMISLGAWPDVSLEQARDKRDAERKLLAKKIDPSAKRRAEKLADAHTFESVGREFLDTQEAALAPKTFARAKWTLENLVFPHVGSQPIATVDRGQILKIIKDIEAQGKLETARRVGQRCAQVFDYALNTSRVQINPVASRKGAMAKRVKAKKHAAITDPAGIGQLLRDIDGYSGHGVTLYALKIAPYLFVRPGELRHMEWTEIDLDSSEPTWTIPAHKMKMRRVHLVPLARQAVALLREIRKLTGPATSRPNAKYVFPAMTTATRPMSENTENTAIRRLGYDNTQMTAHGFRSMASTRLNSGLERSAKPGDKYRPNRDWIEAQQAHAEGDSVRAAYNEAEYIDERREMMTEWANYLDRLRAAKA